MSPPRSDWSRTWLALASHGRSRQRNTSVPRLVTGACASRAAPRVRRASASARRRHIHTRAAASRGGRARQGRSHKSVAARRLFSELHALLPQRHVAQHAHLPSPRAPLVSPLRARGRPSDFTSARAGRAAHPARRRNLARRAVALGPDHGRLAPPLEPFTSHLVRARPVPDGPPARRRERCRLRAGAARGQERGELARRREAR